jgi:hypothetical protein
MRRIAFRRGPRLTVAILALVALVAVVAVQIGSPGERASDRRAVVTTVIGGDVAVRASPSDRPRPAIDREIVPAGATVMAGQPNGRAVLTFWDGSTVALEPGASVVIEESSTADRGELRVRLRQEHGTTWSHVQPLLSAASRFIIATPAATAVVRGTSFELSVSTRGPADAAVTTVAVFTGTVDLVAAGQVRPVNAHQVAEVIKGEPPGAAAGIGPATSCLLVSADPSVLVTVTDPDGRSAGLLPGGTVNQIPRTRVSPQADDQGVAVRSPPVGEWEVGVAPRTEGGAFRIGVHLLGPPARGLTQELVGTTRTGQRSVARIRVGSDGTVAVIGSFEEAARSRANIAPAPIGGTTTAPLPHARPFTTSPALPPGCSAP